MLTNIILHVIITKLSTTPWEHSSAGRASALQAEGHRFEPCCSHQSRRQRFYAPVAQLVEQWIENPRVVGSIPTGGTTRKTLACICGRSSSGRAPPCQGGGSEFEPRRPLQLPFFSGMYPEGGIQFLFFCSIYFLFLHLCKCCTEVFLFLWGLLFLSPKRLSVI